MYGFTQFCTWFVERHPGYFIAPLRINGSGIESMFSLFKFCAAGNLSANNNGSIRGRVITGKEVVSNSNSERGYRDDRILVSGNLQQSETSAGSRVAYSVRVVFDPFGLDMVKEFRFSLIQPLPVFNWWMTRQQRLHTDCSTYGLSFCHIKLTTINKKYLTEFVV